MGAHGATPYRHAALTREQLWALVEGPTTDRAARTAAATVLAETMDDADRARMRLAAVHCAEPRLRIAIGALARASTSR